LLSVNRFSLFGVLCLSLALLVAPQSHADTSVDTSLDRTVLTRATLELQRDILLTKEKYHPEERLGLGIYLDLGDLAKVNIDSISITLDGVTAIQQTLDAAEMAMLMDGAMKRLGMIPLRPGSHVLKTTVKSGGRSVTKTVELDKSAGRDHLRITITSLPQQHAPDISYTHETWAAEK
jgi:hypothetical protein